ncbi:metalloregulator ArsR/SmtB family transcription factor [Chitinophaga agrisoli]|uniref:Metalloregulator ArsR/SmtB family transcription factor n=1 Tax=Chitinophaga agrisoli TaxID=2607653 RepID=A0A5B2VKX7_9BACT|nr:metalloregulator ArsR/SmtB family transcription factor [Chitinophaga agrisoli]KAA2239474.1 metalloregulator ArsR/SmtB family transcription factor [Chitinophaga agrisoli]
MDELFKGLADPVRRQILELLLQQPLNVNQINEHFSDISRQAVSKHLSVLEDSGWIRIYQAGRERYGYLNKTAFYQLKDWLQVYLNQDRRSLRNDHGVFLERATYKKGAPLTYPVMLQAMLSKDKDFDNRFFNAVKTTGIFCKPSCSANPRPDNVIFYGTRDEAIKNGFRACKRCKP